MSGRNSLSIRTILVDLTKKIGNLFLLLSRRLDTVEVVVDEEAERCPCCGYTPWDCDDH